MLSLPNEIITIIAYFLEPNERTIIRDVNTLLNKLLSNHRLWQNMNNEFIRDKFQKICGTENLYSARRLTKTFNLTQENARSNDNYTFRWSCKNSHIIELLKTLFNQ